MEKRCGRSRSLPRFGERYEALIGVTGQVETRPRVLALTQFGDKIWTAGKDSTEGGVISAAGD